MLSSANLGVQRKQPCRRKWVGKEELVKHMSNLPSYLERGENYREKALNVGVLDWKQLEKWLYNHKEAPFHIGKYSPYSSNTSPFSSSDGSSTRSSRGQSCSPDCQEMHMLQAHLNDTLSEAPEGLHSSISKIEEFLDLTDSPTNPLKAQHKNVQTRWSSSKTLMEAKLQRCKWSNTDQKVIHDTKACQNVENCLVEPYSKGKLKIKNYECPEKQETLQDLCYKTVDNDCPKRPKSIFPVFPRDGSEKGPLMKSHPSQVNGRRSLQVNHRIGSEGYSAKDVHPQEVFSGPTHVSPLPCEPRGCDGTKTIHVSSKSSQTASFPVRTSDDPSKSRNVEDGKSTVMPMNSPTVKPSEGSDAKLGIAVTTEVRNMTPTRRHSISISRMGKGSRSKGSEVVPEARFNPVAAKSSMGIAEPSSWSNGLTGNKTCAPRRSQSSPLRRLLDPLLKEKAIKLHQSVEPLQKDSTFTNRVCKSSNVQGEASMLHSVKEKLNLTKCQISGINNSHQEKPGLSTVQALFHVASRNGLPLFTFAVNKKNDILVATMRRWNASTNDDSSRKEGNSWIYTFFTVHEMRKKTGGWLNQLTVGKDPSYFPNVVAQMKVSDFLHSNVSRQEKSQVGIRECVLFSVDLTHLDHPDPRFLPNYELAAIIIKLPGETITDSIHGGKVSDNCNDMSSVANQDGSTTVILPGGVHGLPSKGEPSPLMERWKSGGLCDCGGWDMGCRIGVLANKNQVNQTSTSIKDYVTDGKFELFSQGEEVDDRLVFSMSPFKDGIFSVEFNSSLSLLQAFSICIAVLNRQKPSQISGNIFEENSHEKTTLLDDNGIKVVPNRNQVEAPGRYTSYPPCSPVGRV